jgi:hypothetical protein
MPKKDAKTKCTITYNLDDAMNVRIMNCKIDEVDVKQRIHPIQLVVLIDCQWVNDSQMQAIQDVLIQYYNSNPNSAICYAFLGSGIPELNLFNSFLDLVHRAQLFRL